MAFGHGLQVERLLLVAIVVIGQAVECLSRADVVFLVDSSGSVGRDNFTRTLDFISSLASQLNVDADYTRLAMITFNTKAKIIFYLNTHRTLDDIQRSIYGAHFTYGDSNVADAFRTARESIFIYKHGDRPGVRNILVLLTDGDSNVSPWRTIPEAEKCREAGIHVMTIGIGLENTREAQELVSKPDSYNLLQVEGYSDLQTVIPTVTEAICDDGDSCAVNNCLNGGTCVDGIRFYKCLCPDGYSGQNCEKSEICNRYVDLVFAFDTSGGLPGPPQFRPIFTFANQLTRLFPVDSRAVRVGAFGFCHQVRVSFHLQAGQTASDVQRQMQKVPYRTGPRNLHQAMQNIRDTMFLEAHGDRRAVQNVAVIITDGFTGPDAEVFDQENRHLKQRDIEVIQIVINQPGRERIQPSGDRLFAVNSVSELHGIMDDVKQAICDIASP